MQQNGDELVELLLMPKIGRAKAKVLYSHGYKNIADIAAADPLDLSKVPGISLELAKELIKFVNIMGSAHGLSDDSSETHKCPMCGSLVPQGADSCSGCGITFTNEWEHSVGEKYQAGTAKTPEPEDDSKKDGFWYKENEPTLFICPECGSLVDPIRHTQIRKN